MFAKRSLAVFRRLGERPTSESGEEVALAKYGGPSSKSCPSGTICQQRTTVKCSPGPLAVTRVGGWHCPQQFHEVSTVGGFYGLAHNAGLESASLAIWVKRLLKPRLVVPPRSRVQAGPIASRGPLVKALQARAATFASLSVGAVPWRRPSPGVTAEAEP